MVATTSTVPVGSLDAWLTADRADTSRSSPSASSPFAAVAYEEQRISTSGTEPVPIPSARAPSSRMNKQQQMLEEEPQPLDATFLDCLARKQRSLLTGRLVVRFADTASAARASGGSTTSCGTASDIHSNASSGWINSTAGGSTFSTGDRVSFNGSVASACNATEGTVRKGRPLLAAAMCSATSLPQLSTQGPVLLDSLCSALSSPNSDNSLTAAHARRDATTTYTTYTSTTNCTTKPPLASNQQRAATAVAAAAFALSMVALPDDDEEQEEEDYDDGVGSDADDSCSRFYSSGSSSGERIVMAGEASCATVWREVQQRGAASLQQSWPLQQTERKQQAEQQHRSDPWKCDCNGGSGACCGAGALPCHGPAAAHPTPAGIHVPTKRGLYEGTVRGSSPRNLWRWVLDGSSS